MRAGGPKSSVSDNKQFGLHHGLVTQNKDPDGLERIKVSLPWLDGGETDQAHWAQLLTPMEGDKFGWYTLPDIGDSVIVAFIGGDITQPIIMGGTWSKADISPEPNSDGKNNFRGYRSRSGHRLILDDTVKTKVVFADKTAKNMIGIGMFAEAGEGPNKCAVYKPPMSAEMGVSFSSMEGKLNITCKNGTLSIKAEGKILLNAKTTFDMKAGSDMKLEGSSNATVTSSSPAHLDTPNMAIN